MVNSVNSASSISQLFSKLDTKKQGYLEKSDLVSAFSQIDSSSDSTSVDQLFTALDSDGDGKVSESEFSSTLTKLQEELDGQFNSMRMSGFQGAQGAGMGGTPPPPPPQDDEGFTKDELQSQLDEIGDSDSERSSFISNVVNNFDKADTNGDGKVTFAEAQAYQEQSNGTTDGTSATSASAATQSDAQLMKQIMQLMHAYSSFNDNNTNSSLSSLLSVSA